MPLAQAQILRIPAAGATLNADLVVPVDAKGIVLFAHGSGSSRHSHRNQFVARVLQDSGFGTLLMDLLTSEEERIDNQTRAHRFDINLLATRLGAAVTWTASQPTLKALPIGLFGASTGAAAAIVAAVRHPDLVRSVVSRGGRPDLAGEQLAVVKTPIMLIVGGYDDAVLVLNEQAKAKMTGEVSLKVVPRATHLFEESGALAQVADYAAAWFLATLKASSQ
ncbi:MAG TPA: dienelactone hydrolase family protein [Vicinamibacterales bacterium]|nr:dienelactone hydrolase family protein [Vicinamibacterales bacterium]